MRESNCLYPNLLKMINDKGITFDDMAEKLDVCASTIYLWLAGTYPLLFSRKQQIHDEFFPTTDYLWLFEKTKDPEILRRSLYRRKAKQAANAAYQSKTKELNQILNSMMFESLLEGLSKLSPEQKKEVSARLRRKMR